MPRTNDEHDPFVGARCHVLEIAEDPEVSVIPRCDVVGAEIIGLPSKPERSHRIRAAADTEALRAVEIQKVFLERSHVLSESS
jgi:hypothetical protein